MNNLHDNLSGRNSPVSNAKFLAKTHLKNYSQITPSLLHAPDSVSHAESKEPDWISLPPIIHLPSPGIHPFDWIL